ncbi:MAG TPA: methyltransferase domain-containing protein [Ktedonobacteraceae bacterium]|nr:methyltransferase domain-containing protein [Ktedonobacteraceae bacterium]
MEMRSFKDSWSQIDRTADPVSYVRYMDAFKESEHPAYWSELRSHLQAHGHRDILDVGCGLGASVRVAAKIVGPGGRSVGLDNSEAMLQSARERAKGLNLPIEYYQSDAHHLPFENDTFDYSHSDGVFDILPDPVRALDEMVRVTRPGGCIEITAEDSMMIDATDRTLTRRITSFIEDHEMNGWLGRQLAGLFKERGLLDVTVTPRNWVIEDYALFSRLGLRTFLANVQAAGVVTAEEVRRWLADLEQRFAQGRFFAAFCFFEVMGRKP